MISLFHSPARQISLCVFVVSLVLLPALYFQQLPLAATALTVLSLAFLLFTRPFYALLAYVMLIPFEELAVFADLGTPTRLAGLLFFATYLFHRRFQINLRVMPVVAWLWLGWVTASLLWSPVLKWDFYFQGVQLFIATLLITDYLSREPKRINAILNGYSISAVIIALFGIYNFFSGVGDATRFSFESRVSGVEGQDVATFAFSLIPAFLTAFHHLVRPKQKKMRWLNVTLMLVFAIAMILSGTRGSWVATIGAIIIVYVPRLKPRHYLTLATTIILGVVVAFQVPVISEFIRYRTSDAVSSGGAGRTAIWFVSWQIYLDHPVIGIGWRMAEYVMNIEHFERAPQDITWDNRGFRPRVTHNIYLQTLLELGIIGLVLFMFWMILLITAPLYRDKVLRDDWLLALAIFMAMLVGGITNPEFHKKYYWLALALPQGLRYYWMLQQNRKQLSTVTSQQTLSTFK
jgi:O-antigen ligase